MGTPDPEPARIKVERFDGKLLVFAGAKDMMWQSDRAAEIIRQHKPDAEVHVYPDAGHLFGLDNWYVMGLAMGGTAEATSRRWTTAGRWSWSGSRPGTRRPERQLASRPTTGIFSRIARACPEPTKRWVASVPASTPWWRPRAHFGKTDMS